MKTSKLPSEEDSHIPFVLLKNYAKSQVSAQEKEEIIAHIAECSHCRQVFDDIQFYLEKHRNSSNSLDKFIQKSASQQKFDELLTRQKRLSYIRPLQAAVIVLLLAPALWLWQQYGSVSEQVNNAPLAIQIDTAGRAAARYQSPAYTNEEPLIADNATPQRETPLEKNTVSTKDLPSSSANPHFLDGAIAANFTPNEAFENQMNMNVRAGKTEQIIMLPAAEQLITDTLRIVWADNYEPTDDGIEATIYNNQGKEMIHFLVAETQEISLKTQLPAKGLYYLSITDSRQNRLHTSKFYYGKRK
jgi:hypothetical protein